MNVTLTNLTPVEVPLSSTEGEGYALQLEPGVAYEIDDEDATVVTVGDNPSFKEDVADFLHEARDELVRLVTFWRHHAPKYGSGPKAPPVVKLHIDNTSGTQGLRVLQGDDRTQDFEIGPGESATAEALEYVEIRELGADDDEEPSDQTG